MRKILILLTVVSCALSCRSKVDPGLQASDVVTLGHEDSKNSVILSGKLGTRLEPADVSEVGFLVSEDADMPDATRKVFVTAMGEGKNFARTITFFEMEDGKRGVDYYYTAYAFSDGKQYTGHKHTFSFEPIPITGLSVKPSTAGIEVGKTVTLTPEIIPPDATDIQVSWSTSDKKVATVSDGVVTGMGVGTATITAHAGELEATCEVTVKTQKPDGAVDLGLKVYWAACNVGASTPEGYGGYYAWGETSTKEYYLWTNYSDKLYNQSTGKFRKYCTNSSYGTVDSKTVLDKGSNGDDVASKVLGGKWRMPTYEDLKELQANCTFAKDTRNGVAGIKVTSKINGNTLFLPAAGLYNTDNYNVINKTKVIAIWSSSLDTSDNKEAYYARIGIDETTLTTWFCTRPCGLSVRAVSD